GGARGGPRRPRPDLGTSAVRAPPASLRRGLDGSLPLDLRELPQRPHRRAIVGRAGALLGHVLDARAGPGRGGVLRRLLATGPRRQAPAHLGQSLRAGKDANRRAARRRSLLVEGDRHGAAAAPRGDRSLVRILLSEEWHS